MAEISENATETLLEKQKALVTIRNWGGSKEDRVTLAKAAATISPEVVDRQLAYDTARAYRKLMQVFFNNTERDAQLVSRELTRRVGAQDRDRRETRWGGG